MLKPTQSGAAKPRKAFFGSDKRKHQRVKVSLLGRYMLPNRQEFPCQTIDMSPGGMSVAAPVKGQVGDRVIVYLDSLGRVEGKVTRMLPDGFAMNINMPLAKRDKVASQLTWFCNRSTLGLPEDRRHERIEPRNTASVLKLKDGRELKVSIIDISRSGAGVRCEYQPPIFELVHIGDTAGRVIRHFAGGVAIEFTRQLPAELFDKDLRL